MSPIPHKTALITGSGGLISSESVRFLHDRGFTVIRIENDMRSCSFGADASTSWNTDNLITAFPRYKHYSIDIRDKRALTEIFSAHRFDLIIHCAAQPSHGWAAREPYTDFEVNAYGTLILLEHFRQHCPNAVFIFTSTNKVYGDTPNTLSLIECETRYEIDKNHPYADGIDETMSIDTCKHSLFGASKVSADLFVQEYGRYFDLYTACFRGGCLTGPAHSPELHGFLTYLVKCIATGTEYSIFGYLGKQIRDNIHSYDLVNAFYHFYQSPRCGEVYNIGGARHSHISVMEAISAIEKRIGKKANITYVNENRIEDHIWYISSVAKFMSYYPA
jgi:CDP-paratose 2-epimerase